MTETKSGRAHLIAGGFPPGSMSGHDHDYARLRLLGLLAERDIPASVANDFADVEKWLPVSQLLITYVAGPYPDAAQSRAIQRWLEAGGHWLGLHGTSGGRAERVEGAAPAPHRQDRAPRAARQPLFDPSADLRDPRRGERDRLPAHPRARHVFRRRGRAVFHRAARSGLGADPADRGLRRERHLTRRSGPSTPSDTSLQSDGRTRVLGYTRAVGNGGVTYFALGHCHNPAIRAARTADPADTTPPTFRGAVGNQTRSWRCCATPSPGACAADPENRPRHAHRSGVLPWDVCRIR